MINKIYISNNTGSLSNHYISLCIEIAVVYNNLCSRSYSDLLIYLVMVCP